MSITIQIKLQSELAKNIANSLGKEKRIFIEQAMIYYAKKLAESGLLDVYFTSDNLEDILNNSVVVKNKTNSNKKVKKQTDKKIAVEQNQQKNATIVKEEHNFSLDF